MSADPIDSPFHATGHDHSACVEDAMRDAEAYCVNQGLRLTANRRRVLEIIWRGHGPVKAYDIIDAMNGAGQRTAPPTVYRALARSTRPAASKRCGCAKAHLSLPIRQLLICGA